MAAGLRHHPGGIRGLCDLLDEHAEAVEYDLLVHGYRLADLLVTFSWRDLLVMVRRWMNMPGTATGEAVRGHVIWSDQEHLLATLIDAIQIGNWQRVGKKSVPRPKPITRPGSKRKGRTFGSAPVPISQFWGWWNNAGAGRPKRKKKP